MKQSDVDIIISLLRDIKNNQDKLLCISTHSIAKSMLLKCKGLIHQARRYIRIRSLIRQGKACELHRTLFLEEGGKSYCGVCNKAYHDYLWDKKHFPDLDHSEQEAKFKYPYK